MHFPEDRWQRLWRLVPTPIHDLEALSRALEVAIVAGPDAAFDSAKNLPPSVRWAAEDGWIAETTALAAFLGLVELVIAWNVATDQSNKGALMRCIGESILKLQRLTRSIQPSQNQRCYCGSGKNYKQCHGADEPNGRMA